MKGIATVLLLLCACVNVPAKVPEAEQSRAQAAMRQIVPGVPESLVLQEFPKTDKPATFCIVDMETLQNDDGVQHTYWIGYVAYNPSTRMIETFRYAAITALNGTVKSVYYP